MALAHILELGLGYDSMTNLNEAVDFLLESVRRVLVVNDGGICAGIVVQADVARTAPKREIAELVREAQQAGHVSQR